MTDSRVPIENQELDALRSGRDREFARMFEENRARLRRIAAFRLDYRLRGRVSESDIVQDTYVRAASHLEQYLERPDFPLFVWLRLELQQRLAEVHRQHLEAGKRDVRREKNLGGGAGQTSIALAAQLVGQMTSASRMVERNELMQTLEKALDEINEIDREVIALRHFEELTNIETARILGIDPQAASKRYLRALKRMREIFQRITGDAL
jgi:RNA polymerase sigma-70 factor (subfamily 1)